MSREKNRFIYSLCMVIALTAALSLGACSTKKAKSMSGAASQMSDEEREQLEARDPGFADSGALEDVHFDFDKSDLTDSAREILSRNSEWIVANPSVKVQVEGHCDERGTEEYNLALGERRANSVKNYLTSMGVEGDRIYTISYGEELPVDPQHDEGAWAQNRRAHFLVTQ